MGITTRERHRGGGRGLVLRTEGLLQPKEDGMANFGSREGKCSAHGRPAGQ